MSYAAGHLNAANRRSFRRNSSSPSYGFSLIELMVGMVVALICVLAMMSAFAVFEGQKRTTASGGNAQQNGSFSLYEMERLIRSAGSGIVQGKNWSLYNCAITSYAGSTQWLPTKIALPSAIALWPTTTRMNPVLIASGGVAAGSNPDVIGVIGGNPSVRVFQATLSGTSGATVTLNNSFGIFAGDYLALSDTSGSGKCTIGLATTPAPNSSTNLVTLDTTNSPSGGFGSSYSGTGTLFDLGPTPTFALFGVDLTSDSLVQYDLLQRGSTGGAVVAPVTIADGIIQMKAVYGISNGAGGMTWVQPTGAYAIASLTPTPDTAAAATARATIVAVRVAVVAQSELPERAANYTGKTTLTLFPDLAGLSYVVNTKTQYRYKVYDTTIPVRNAMISTFF